MRVMAASSDGPDWVRETIVATREDLRRYVATAIGFTLRPRRFAERWIGGELSAQHPLGVLANALAISGALGVLLGVHVDGLGAQLAQWALPYLYYVGLGVLAHAMLRVTGPTRRLRASIAIALYTGGGPGLLGLLVMWAIGGTVMALHGAGGGLHGIGVLIVIVMLAPYVFVLTTLARGLGGAHGAGPVRTTLALLFALLVSAIVFGTVSNDFPVPHVAIDVAQWPPAFGVWVD